MANKSNQLLGELLVEKGIITALQLEEALLEKAESNDFIGQIVIQLGLANEDEVMPILAEQLGTSYVKIKDMEINPEVINKVPAKFASHWLLVPIKFDNNKLTIALSNPLDVHTLDDIRLLLNIEVAPVLAGNEDIREALRKYYGVGAATIEELAEDSGKKEDLSLKKKAVDIETLAEDASVVKFVNQMIMEAYQDRATDIHIEPYGDELNIRYRIDGVLYDAKVPHQVKFFQAAIISRIKIMASMNIAERRLPQDGRIKVKVKNRELDLRVSTLPTPYGESVEIRLLMSGKLLDLRELGLDQADLDTIAKLIKIPHGIIYVTGPTGSGKTTSLYAFINKINTKDKKIITIEDPIECELKGITQIQVQPKIGLTFAQGLRSMLRHDPDVMMVGEVRDYETAEIAVRVALTGHLVFSTLHTNNSAGSFTRLLDMGVEPFLLSSSIEAVIAQRLVRLICPDCKKEITPEPEVIRELGAGVEEMQGVKIYRGEGCRECKFTGYKGRTGIYEIIVVSDKLKDLIMKRSSADIILKQAKKEGMKTMRDDGWNKIKAGKTTISEVLRVTEDV